jgi:hypothetical protein
MLGAAAVWAIDNTAGSVSVFGSVWRVFNTFSKIKFQITGLFLILSVRTTGLVFRFHQRRRDEIRLLITLLAVLDK